MTAETLDKANEIQKEMDKLKHQIGLIENNAGCGFRWRRLLKTRKKKFILTHYDDEYIMDLSTEDIETLQNLRLKKYHELKKQLEELK